MKSEKHSEAGFSLLELIIVVIICGIVASLALIAFNKSADQFQRQNIARQLQSFLERARADSIKRRVALPDEMAKLTINNANSYTLLSDLNSDGVLSSAENRQVSLPPTSKITGNNLVFPIVVSFNYRGQVTAIDGNNSVINPVFTVCDADCTQSNADEKNSNVIAVSPTGTISFLEGGKSLPNANLQNSANVTANTKINRNGIVNN